MKQTIYISTIFAALLLLSGCRDQDAEANAFANDLNRLTLEITTAFRAAPTVEGIEAAQRKLAAERDALQTRYSRLKAAREFQISRTTAKIFADSVERNIQSVARLQTDNAAKIFADREFGEKMMRLISDYNSIFGE